MQDTWFLLLGDETGNRVVTAIIGIMQTLGTIVPLILGAIVYAKRSRQNARQEVFNFFVNWLSPDRQNRRDRYRKIMLEQKDVDEFFSEDFMEQRGIVTQKLNEDELLAIYILYDQKREKEAKNFAQAILIRDWELAEKIVKVARERTNNPKLYTHLETVVKRWSS